MTFNGKYPHEKTHIRKKIKTQTGKFSLMSLSFQQNLRESSIGKTSKHKVFYSKEKKTRQSENLQSMTSVAEKSCKKNRKRHYKHFIKQNLVARKKAKKKIEESSSFLRASFRKMRTARKYHFKKNCQGNFHSVISYTPTVLFFLSFIIATWWNIFFKMKSSLRFSCCAIWRLLLNIYFHKSNTKRRSFFLTTFNIYPVEIQSCES